MSGTGTVTVAVVAVEVVVWNVTPSFFQTYPIPTPAGGATVVATENFAVAVGPTATVDPAGCVFTTGSGTTVRVTLFDSTPAVLYELDAKKLYAPVSATPTPVSASLSVREDAFASESATPFFRQTYPIGDAPTALEVNSTSDPTPTNC
jgi:hypothetical protein